MSGTPEIAVVGPGAIGATIAAELSRAGHAVSLCGRREGPEIIVERAGHAPVTLGPVRTDPSGVGPVRWLLLAVKAHQTPGAAAWLSALADAETTVLVLQNGIDQRALVSAFLPAATTVVPSVVWFSAEACRIEVSPDYERVAWRKLTQNAVAGLTVLAGRRSGMFRRAGELGIPTPISDVVVPLLAAASDGW